VGASVVGGGAGDDGATGRINCSFQSTNFVFVDGRKVETSNNVAASINSGRLVVSRLSVRGTSRVRSALDPPTPTRARMPKGPVPLVSAPWPSADLSIGKTRPRRSADGRRKNPRAPG
jgi:hypothetical protein